MDGTRSKASNFATAPCLTPMRLSSPSASSPMSISRAWRALGSTEAFSWTTVLRRILTAFSRLANASSIAASVMDWSSPPMNKRGCSPPASRDEDASYAGSVVATNLKVSGVNVFSAGDFLGGEKARADHLCRSAHGSLQETRHLDDDRLVGAVLIGDTGAAPVLSRPDPLRRGCRSHSRRVDVWRPRLIEKGGVTMSGDFTLDQKRYLEGFAAGLGAARPRRASAKPIGPDAIHFEAQDRVASDGGKLSDQEKWKREEHPFDAYPRLVAQAKGNEPPKPPTIFAGAITACSMSRRRKIPTCAGCAFPTARCRTGSSPALPISPRISAAAICM